MTIEAIYEAESKQAERDVAGVVCAALGEDLGDVLRGRQFRSQPHGVRHARRITSLLLTVRGWHDGRLAQLFGCAPVDIVAERGVLLRDMRDSSTLRDRVAALSEECACIVGPEWSRDFVEGMA